MDPQILGLASDPSNPGRNDSTSDLLWTSHTHRGLMVFLTTHCSRGTGESRKEPVSYLPLILLIENPPQNSLLARATQLILRIWTAPLVGDQRSKDSDSTVLPALPCQPSRQNPCLESLGFSRHSFTLQEPILVLSKAQGSLCVLSITHTVSSAAIPMLIPRKSCTQTQVTFKQ